MKSVIILMIFLLLSSLFYTGCGKSEQENQSQPAEESSAAPDRYRISSGAEARYEDLKAEYIAKVKTRVSDINDKIDALVTKKEGAPADLLEDIEKSLKIANEKNDILQKQFTKLENASEEDYEIEKTAFIKALNDAEDAVADLQSQF